MRPFPRGDLRIMDSTQTIEAYTSSSAWVVWLFGYGTGTLVMAIAAIADHFLGHS